MATIKYLDKAGLKQVIGALGDKLEYNDTIPHISLRNFNGDVGSKTLVVPSEVVWDSNKRLMIGIVIIGNTEYGYSQWPNCERWINVDQGLPIPNRLFFVPKYNGEEYFAIWLNDNDEKPFLFPANNKRRPIDGLVPLVSGVKRKHITLNAQPGIVYKNYDGWIRIKLKGGINSFNINNLYIPDSYGWYVPLSSTTLRLKIEYINSNTHKEIDVAPDDDGNIIVPYETENSQVYIRSSHSKWIISELSPKCVTKSLISLIKDNSGRKIFIPFDANVGYEKIAAPDIYDLEIKDDKIWGCSQVQTWRRGGTINKTWSWRKYHAKGKHPTKYHSFYASKKQRTVLVRVRNIKRRIVSEWKYLKLWRANPDDIWHLAEVHFRAR